MSNLQAQLQNRLPSQPYPNPKENVSVITLRNEKELKEPIKKREEEPELEIKGDESELNTAYPTKADRTEQGNKSATNR